MCHFNYAYHPCQHTTYYGFHPCTRARMTRIMCISNSTIDRNPPPTFHTPPPPTCSNPSHLPPTLATIPSPFANTTHAHSRPDTLVLTTSVSKLDFSAASNLPTGTSSIRGKYTSKYPYPPPVGFGTHAAFGLDELNSGFTIPPLPTAKLQYYPRKVDSQIIRVGGLCRDCEKEVVEGEWERRFMLGQRAYVRERAERKGRQELLLSMVGGLKRRLGARGEKREDWVVDIILGEEWWDSGRTEMPLVEGKGKEKEVPGGVDGERNGVVTGENGEEVVRSMEDVEATGVVAEGDADVEQPKAEWRKFFKSKKPEGTVEGGGVFSGFTKVDERRNMWRWDGAEGNMDMDILSGANLNMEVPNMGTANPDLPIEAADTFRQTTDMTHTQQANPFPFARALDYGTPSTHHRRRISEGGHVMGEGDSGFTVSSTSAQEPNFTRRTSEDGGMFGEEHLDSHGGNRMVDMNIAMGAAEADRSLQEEVEVFTREFVEREEAVEGKQEGDDVVMERVVGREEEEGWMDFELEEESDEQGDDSGSEYEPPEPGMEGYQ